jgi:tetratricopeptide (TPR) repeat protein
MMRRWIRLGLVTALLTLAPWPLLADELVALPAPWADRLLPVEPADLGGAERLMREATEEARQEVAARLADPATPAVELAETYGRLGALYLLMEVETAADACFRNAQTLAPEDFRWPYYAGYLALMVGDTDRALKSLAAAQAIDPSYPPLALRLGKVHLDRSELAEARVQLETIAEAPGLVTAANYYLGQIALLERRFENALAHLQRALEADPDATEVHYPLAQAYRALGRKELARDHLRRFALKTPQAEDPLLAQLEAATKRSVPAFQKGMHAIREGDYATATRHFAEGLAIDPGNAAARVSYARALYLAGRGDEAGAELGRALETDPSQVLAQFLAAVLHQQGGEADAARLAYARTLELDPNHAGAAFYLANLDFAEGRYQEAAQGYQAALAADREIPPARLLRLIARYHAGVSDTEIADALDALIQEHPEDPMIKYALVRLLAAGRDPQVRDPKRALDLASRLALLQPIPPHQRALAIAQAAAGEREQAVASMQQALLLAAWMAPPAERELMETELAALRAGELPEPWPLGDPLLAPPPFDPLAPFRDYPAALPY